MLNTVLPWPSPILTLDDTSLSFLLSEVRTLWLNDAFTTVSFHHNVFQQGNSSLAGPYAR